MQNLHPLARKTAHEAVYIDQNDMIHITWRHITFRINATGFIYLVDFLNGDDRRRAIGFDVYGTPDDGYCLWIQDAGLRLSPADSHRFKQLLVDGLTALRDMGKHGETHHLPHHLKLTFKADSLNHFSHN